MNDLIATIEQMQAEAREGMKRASRDSDPYLYQYMVGKFHAFGKVAGILKKQMKIVSPRLAESEDERMMREFNDWLCEEIECRTNDLRDEKDRRTLNMLCYVLTKVKNWLEKQKEPENTSASTMAPSCWEVEQKEQKPINFVEELKHYLATTPREQLEKEWKEIESFGSFGPTVREYLYGEQKPNYCHYGGDPSVERCKYCSATCSARLTEEQKPAEERDLSGLTDLERVIHRGFLSAGVENVPVTIIKETAQECLAQMKPAEWSEEDERRRDGIIQWLREYQKKFNPKYDSLSIESIESLIDWLKSLRDRPKQPEIFDTVAFQKGVAEGKRLMMEGATYNELMELYRAIRDELVKRHRDVPVNIKEEEL